MTPAGRYPVRVIRRQSRALFEVRGLASAAEALLGELGLPVPVDRNRWAKAGGPVSVARLGPARWLVSGPPEEEASLEARLADATAERAEVDAICVTDQVEAFALVGGGAVDLLAQGTPLDLGAGEPALGMITGTDLFGVGVLLEQGGPGAADFTVLIERSFGDWLEAWLTVANGLPSSIRPANLQTEPLRRRTQAP